MLIAVVRKPCCWTPATIAATQPLCQMRRIRPARAALEITGIVGSHRCAGRLAKYASSAAISSSVRRAAIVCMIGLARCFERYCARKSTNVAGGRPAIDGMPCECPLTRWQVTHSAERYSPKARSPAARVTSSAVQHAGATIATSATRIAVDIALLYLRSLAGVRRHVEGARPPDDRCRTRRAIAHARVPLPKMLLGGLAIVVEKIRLVAEPDRGKIPVVELEIPVRDNVVEIEHIGRDGIELVVGQRLRVAIWHGAADVIHEGRGVGPVRADRFYRIVARQGAGAAAENRPACGALAELAVTGGAALHVQRLALLHGALAGRQALPVRSDGDVPAGNLLRRGGAADPQAPGSGHRVRRRSDRWTRRAPGVPRKTAAECGQACGCRRREHDRVTTLRHSPPRRSCARARSGCRCCDRRNSPHGSCAVRPWSAGRSRSRRWRATAATARCRPSRSRSRTASAPCPKPGRRVSPCASCGRRRAKRPRAQFFPGPTTRAPTAP